MTNRTSEIVLRRRIDAKYYRTKAAMMLKYVALMAFLMFLCVQFIQIGIKNEKLENSIKEKDAKIETLTASLDNLSSKYFEKTLSINSMKENETALLSVIEDLNKEVSSVMKDSKLLEKEYDNLYDKYSVLADRKELYDKYEYAVMYDGKRTELTYDNIKLGVELMGEKGYDPNIIFGIMAVESSYNPNCKSKISSATGLGQFLAGTGKWVYEDLMKNGKGSYSHSMALDPEINIEMMTVYLDYLMKANNYNLYSAIKTYRGENDKIVQAYIDKINRVMAGKANIYALAKNYSGELYTLSLDD